MDFSNFLSPELTTLALSLFGITAVRTALGIFAAVKDGTFVLSATAAFLRSQVVGRVFPILTVSYFAQTSDNVALIASAAATGAAYLAETAGAVMEALSSSAAADTAEKTITAEAAGNPVPQD